MIKGLYMGFFSVLIGCLGVGMLIILYLIYLIPFGILGVFLGGIFGNTAGTILSPKPNTVLISTAFLSFLSGLGALIWLPIALVVQVCLFASDIVMTFLLPKRMSLYDQTEGCLDIHEGIMETVKSILDKGFI